MAQKRRRPPTARPRNVTPDPLLRELLQTKPEQQPVISTPTADLRPTTDQAALLGVALAGAITIALTPGPFDLGEAFIGLTLLLVLHAYYIDKGTTRLQRSAFYAVWALCIILIGGFVIELLVGTSLLNNYLILWNGAIGRIDKDPVELCAGGLASFCGIRAVEIRDMAMFIIWVFSNLILILREG